MSIQRKPSNVARDIARQMLPKIQPRRPRPKNPSEAKTRQITEDRAGGRCERCGRPGLTSVHHRVNRSAGGRWSASNCVRLCGSGSTLCHGWVTDHPEAAGIEGFHLKPWERPELSPIASAVHGRVLLTDDGSVHPIGGAA